MNDWLWALKTAPLTPPAPTRPTPRFPSPWNPTTPWLNRFWFGSGDTGVGASHTDSSIASGAAGLTGYDSGTGTRGDTWEAGNLGGTDATLTAATDAIMDAITALLAEIRGEQPPAERWDPAKQQQAKHGRFMERGKQQPGTGTDAP